MKKEIFENIELILSTNVLIQNTEIKEAINDCIENLNYNIFNITRNAVLININLITAHNILDEIQTEINTMKISNELKKILSDLIKFLESEKVDQLKVIDSKESEKVEQKVIDSKESEKV